MENVSSVGLVAFGAVVGVCVTALIEKKRKEEYDTIQEAARIRQQQCRERKREEDEKRELKKERERDDERLRLYRQAVLKRQARSRAKRDHIPDDDRHIGNLLFIRVEDTTLLYESDRVANALEWLAWHLDPKYPKPIPDYLIDPDNMALMVLEKHKLLWDDYWYWDTCSRMLTQKINVTEGKQGTVLDGLHMAMENYPEDEFILVYVVYVVGLIAITVIEMDLGFVYIKHCNDVLTDEEKGDGLRNIFPEDILGAELQDGNTTSPLLLRHIAVNWKVCVLERIRNEFLGYITNVIVLETTCAEEKHFAGRIKRELDHYLFVTRHSDILQCASGGMIWNQEIVHMSKKGKHADHGVRSDVCVDAGDCVEERGTFRRCQNIELLRSRKILKVHVKNIEV